MAELITCQTHFAFHICIQQRHHNSNAWLLKISKKSKKICNYNFTNASNESKNIPWERKQNNDILTH